MEEPFGQPLFPEPIPDWVVQVQKRGCRRPIKSELTGEIPRQEQIDGER